MTSNLVPTSIIDRNGHHKVVYKTTDGRGAPSASERAAYKQDARRVKSFSPYKPMNIIYADDFAVAETGLHNTISHARRHENGDVELISLNIESNIDLTKQDVEKIAAIDTRYDRKNEGYLPQSFELDNGYTVQFFHDGGLVIEAESTGRGFNEINPYDAQQLIEKLAEWSS